MKISAQMLNEASFKREIAKFEKMTGRGVDAGVKQIAESTGRSLASKIRPYGMSAKKGKQFEENIHEQIRHVRYGVNVGAYPGSNISSAHNQQRRNGRVRIRKVYGKGWKDTISEGDMQAYARKQAAKAGMVKAGWIDATNKATGSNLKKIPRWISRHLGKGLGAGRMYKRGANTFLDIENKARHASRAQSDREVRSALYQGRRNALKFMMLQIRKSTSTLR